MDNFERVDLDQIRDYYKKYNLTNQTFNPFTQIVNDCAIFEENGLDPVVIYDHKHKEYFTTSEYLINLKLN